MPPATKKPSEQDETEGRTMEAVLDGAVDKMADFLDPAIDKIADLLDAHCTLQPLWKAVVLGADVVEALHYHITTPLRADVTRPTARALCFDSVLPMIFLSRFLLGSFEDGCLALYIQCAVLYFMYGAFMVSLYAEASTNKTQTWNLLFEGTLAFLTFCVVFVVHSTMSLVDAILALGAFFLPGWLLSVAKIFAGLLWKTDDTQARRDPANSETGTSKLTDGDESCSNIEDAPRPEAELRGTDTSKDSDTTASATPTSNVATILQENLMIAQNNIKLLELAREKDWTQYSADMISCRDKFASMTAAHQAETADLKDRLSKMNAACAQMHITSQQDLNEVTMKLLETETQLEAKRKALENMRNFWEADIISKRNALNEKQIRLEQADAELDSMNKKFKDLAESTRSKEAKWATKDSHHANLLQNLEHTIRDLRSGLQTSQDILYTTQTQLIEARKEVVVLSAQLETSSKEIQNLNQQVEASQKVSENSEKRIKSLKNWCRYWQETAISEHDARMSLHEQVGLAREGIEKIGEEEVEDARRECENEGDMEQEVEDEVEMERQDGAENGMEVEKIENVDDEDWESDDEEYSVAAREE